MSNWTYNHYYIIIGTWKKAKVLRNNRENKNGKEYK